MQKFVFEFTITAPSKEEAVKKMTALASIGKHLKISELQALKQTVNNPAALAIAKGKLGLA